MKEEKTDLAVQENKNEEKITVEDIIGWTVALLNENDTDEFKARYTDKDNKLWNLAIIRVPSELEIVTNEMM